jgi:hypothetical protein
MGEQLRLLAMESVEEPVRCVACGVAMRDLGEYHAHREGRTVEHYVLAHDYMRLYARTYGAMKPGELRRGDR